MLEHNAKSFYYATLCFCRLQSRIDRAIKERSGDSLPTKGEADHTRKFLKRIENEAERLKLSEVSKKLCRFNDDDELLQPLAGKRFTLSKLDSRLEELHEAIQEAISPGNNKFMMIPGKELEYYNEPELFGHKVAGKFRKANKEITEAGNCYATGNYTACVFHLMRVMEIGVQRLGGKLSVPDTKDKEWQTILNNINGALKSMSNPPIKITSAQKATRDKYAQAALLLENVKNAWRNKVMHPKASYDDSEAAKILKAVESYMQYLAELV